MHIVKKNPPASPAATPLPDPRAFEDALIELEAVVARLEQGELSLEEALVAFERGVTLTRACQRTLDEAEQRVRVLTEATVTALPEEFRTDG